MLLERERSKKICVKKLVQFDKGGNCKLKEIIFILIEKISMGTFNTGGNCKLQFPQIKLIIDFELSPSSYIKEGV